MCNPTSQKISGADATSNSCSPPSFWKPRRAIIAFVANLFPCIYLDVVASNLALKRWQLLSHEQKASLPDVVHDNFAYYENHVLKELPTFLMAFVVMFCFMVPRDIMGLSQHPQVSYKRGECWVRFFETRCILELMRACTVFATTMSDPHGLYCTEIETHEVDNIWTTFTLARCGDNIFSGHACHLLSAALCIQTYVLPIQFGRTPRIYWILTAALWLSIPCLCFYVVVSRMHYTVDVVLSCFLVPSVWFAWTGIGGGGGEVGVRISGTEKSKTN
jgi:hypothetical protein